MLHVGEARISRKNAFNRKTLCPLSEAWKNVQPQLADRNLENGARIVLANWRGDQPVRRYANWNELAKAIKLELGRRENYFFGQVGENLNIDTVIFKTDVPASSSGWSEPQFFAELGHPGNGRWFDERVSSRALGDMLVTDFVKDNSKLLAIVTQGLRRRAEQEYLMINMVKGAMWDAAQVADEFKVGIAVRGTGLLAHMGIESGDPTKAQEFKNKTSKEIDLVLCEEMEWSQLGAVVHYDPRVDWSSRVAETNSEQGRSPMFAAAATKADWEKKRLKIPDRLRKLGSRLKVPSDAALEAAFMSRSKEYMEEDREYRKGHYAPYTTLVGPYVRLKVRSDVNMVGDHDLFAFTGPEGKDYGVFMSDTDARVASAQKALQNKPTFQAQHGGIWYWKPGTAFNVGIKQKIMGAHGPDGDEPLVYIRPGKQVTAAYYTTDDKLESVWSNPGWIKWLLKTHSGQLLLNPSAIPGD